MTIELLTGRDRDPDPRDFITKSVAVAPAPPGARPALWLEFLDRVTDGDAKLVGYLQRVAGYCLTGLTKEHAVFFLYGTGANGKTVFVNTLLGIWADYACTIGTEMLMATPWDRHPTEIARLRGVRLAVGSEVESGQTWAEAKLKKLTGGDKLQGRFMRQDFFEFTPQFKLMLAGNHKPSLRGVDEAIRRRLHLIPFTVTIPPRERDNDLQEKLKAEWPAILRWAIDGCLEWQRTGLRPPARVLAATESYFADEDSFELWRADRTTAEKNAWESSAALWQSWRDWAAQAGEFVGTQKAFSMKLAERGFTPAKSSSGNARGYRGAKVKLAGEALAAAVAGGRR